MTLYCETVLMFPLTLCNFAQSAHARARETFEKAACKITCIYLCTPVFSGHIALHTGTSEITLYFILFNEHVAD